MESLVSIVIPAYNQLEYCVQCIDSIRANTRHPYRLILVDNGSTDGVGEYFDSVSGARVFHAEENLGFPKGVNLGMREAEGHVLLLNSDTLVPEGWLGRLVRVLESSDDIGMVGPKSNFVASEQLILDTIKMRPEEYPSFARELAEQNEGRIREAQKLVGFCLLIRDVVARNVGLLDESFGIGNYEDDDYCIRVINAGYRLCIAEDCFVFHYGNRTFSALGYDNERMKELLAENQRRLEEKWTVAVETTPENLARSEELHQQALRALEEGDTVDALRLLQKAIQACARNETNFNDLGVVLWEMGEQERALNCFVRALGLKPGYEQARRNLREVARSLGREEEFGEYLQ